MHIQQHAENIPTIRPMRVLGLQSIFAYGTFCDWSFLEITSSPLSNIKHKLILFGQQLWFPWKQLGLL